MFNDCILYISKYNGNTIEIYGNYMEVVLKLLNLLFLFFGIGIV